MAAYVFVNMIVTDPDRYEQYRPLAGASVEAAGGRYLARGGDAGVLEGDVAANRMVLLEFPDIETARAWYDGEAYSEARAVRAGAAIGSFIVVDGIHD